MTTEKESYRLEQATSREATAPFQFSLMSLFVLITVVCILLAIVTTWPERAFVSVLLTVALAERAYRSRIKALFGVRAYTTVAGILERLGGVISGGMIGGLLGPIVAFVVFNAARVDLGIWSSLKVGVASGAVLGLVYPRAAMCICSFLPC